MSSPALAETLELRVAADLAEVRHLAHHLGSHLRLRGLPLPTWQALELALVEGINNAILHGCRAHPDAEVVVRATWHQRTLTFTVRDPGHFVPGSRWSELPDDPLAEGGRGGFLMSQAFEYVTHHNDASGHALELRTEVSAPPANPASAVDAHTTSLELADELETAFETVSGLRYLVSLLATSTNTQELTERALSRLQKIDGFAFASVRLVRAGQLELFHGWGHPPPLLAALPLSEDSTETRAVLRKVPQRVSTCDQLPSVDPLHRAGGAALVLPIGADRQGIGSLTVVRERGREFFSTGTIELMHTVAEFLGVACAIAQLQSRQRELEITTRELAIAAEMQARLLPTSFPARPDARFFGSCRSAQAIGGDYYDVFNTSDGTLLVIADAMGKGVPAAIIATVLRSTIRAHESLAADPGRLLTVVNRQLTGDLLAMDTFVTAVVGFLPAGGAELRLASAGHCPVLIRRATRRIDTVEGMGGPLGLFPDAEFETIKVPLAAGDTAVFVTDGLFETGATAAKHLGVHGLREALADTAGCDAETTARLLVELVEQGSGPTADDCTLLVCERLTAPAPAAGSATSVPAITPRQLQPTT